MRIHQLKTWPEYLSRITLGQKKFEVRQNDRDFQVGDKLILQEWDKEKQKFTGVELTVIVDYILHGPAFGIQAGYCVMSITY